jgi:pyruvate,water dikinase
MNPLRRLKSQEPPDNSPDESLRRKYERFQELLRLNNECLEIFAELQQDLQYILPQQPPIGALIITLFDKVEAVVSALNYLCDDRYLRLFRLLALQRRAVDNCVSARKDLAGRKLSMSLSDIDTRAAQEVGGKAASLGEIRNRLGLPVPNGFVLTTEAYRRFCGIPLWKSIRDEIKGLDLDDLEELDRCAQRLHELVVGYPIPDTIRDAIEDNSQALKCGGWGLAVRSSAVCEGDKCSFAGQFESYLNVPPDELSSAYKLVVASRFNARALAYRVSRGLLEVETPMAVLFLPTIDAKVSGILYSRNPKNPGGDEIWITASLGLGLDVAGGGTPSDMFVLSRSGAHTLLEKRLFRREEIVLPRSGGGITRRTPEGGDDNVPCLGERELRQLAHWAVKIEQHFAAPQDVEWALDRRGMLWILQSRPLAVVDSRSEKVKPPAHAVCALTGGQTVYPGRTSGPAYVVGGDRGLVNAPRGAVVFIERPTPEIVRVMSRVAGIVAQKGNIAGHAAALLRELKLPSIFQTAGAFDHIETGEAVSLDAVKCRVYNGLLWPARHEQTQTPAHSEERGQDVLGSRVLTLNLQDPDSFSFRPGRCKSAHDVLRFAHERAIEAMFSLSDSVLDQAARGARKVVTSVPMTLLVLDLGGGISHEDIRSSTLAPGQIRSRPFRALWQGLTHPGVTWSRTAPPSLGGIASVLAGALAEQPSAKRSLGDRSYLLAAEDYMNLNARMAYHFSLVDACISETPNNNYVTFRFAGGGAGRRRRNLRASFIQAVLRHYGFCVDRRGDLVNAWFRKVEAHELEDKLDILGRLMACASQLDMYMSSQETARWHVEQFIEGNYSFQRPGAAPARQSQP